MKINYLSKHYYFQHGCFFSSIEESEKSFFTYSDVMTGFIWNYSFPKQLHEAERENYIAEVIQYYKSRGRQPCIYLDTDNQNDCFVSLLKNKGFECQDIEAWMKYTGYESNIDNKLTMQLVNAESLPLFLNICSACFSDDNYSQAIERDFPRTYTQKSFKHFLFYLGDKAIGICSCYYDDELAIIHNVGVIENERMKKYGSEIVLSVINYITKELCITDIILQCDGDTWKEQWYKDIGFVNIYKRFGYVLKDL